jgi:3-hydroxyisobutyrate dehydrogenase
MVKDLGIALGIGSEAGVATPVAAIAREMWMSARAVLGPGCDHTQIAQYSERVAGHEINGTQEETSDASS